MRTTLTIAALALTAVLAGCNKAESPQKVEKDVSSQQKDLDKALNNAGDKVASADKDVLSAQAQGNYDVAVTAAEGEHKVTLEKCEAMNGTAQKTCKEKADANLKIA